MPKSQAVAMDLPRFIINSIPKTGNLHNIFVRKKL